MKRIAIFLLLSLFSGLAVADWTQILDNNDITIYIDKSTIKKTGHIAKIWTLINNKRISRSAHGALYLSVVEQETFDCVNSLGSSYTYFYSGISGSGNIVDTVSEGWSPDIPNSAGDIELKAACGN